MNIGFEWCGSGAQWRFRDMPDLLRQIPGATDYTVREHDDPTNRGCQRLASILLR